LIYFSINFEIYSVWIILILMQTKNRLMTNKRADRKAGLLRLLQEKNEPISIQDLAHVSGLSQSTLRRELHQLVDDGLVRVNVGQVALAGSSEEMPFAFRRMMNIDAKQRIARAASDFERKRTGHAPQTVTVVLSGETLVITLDGALSPAETAVAQNPAGAATVQEFHRQLFAVSSESLCREITRITGVEVRQADPRAATAGAVVPIFAAGAIVQVFLLAGKLPTDTWSVPG
jgi:uncharacterized protein YbcI